MEKSTNLPMHDSGAIRYARVRLSKAAIVLVMLAIYICSATVANAYDGRVSGWIPWFQWMPGMVEVLQNIDAVDTVYPFVYEIEHGRTITDKADTKNPIWQTFYRIMALADIEVIPTIAWFDGVAIHATLSTERERVAHIAEIVNLVEQGGFAGINIDYEQKLAQTIDYFSLFLKELNEALGERVLTCAIEARTPPESRWREVPAVIEYANDYQAIGQYCDRIELMAYDQKRADWQLNQERRGVPYAPVADTAWVEKVVALALEDMPAEKVHLGIATYGRAWDVTVAPDWYRDYQRVASLNVPRMRELSQQYESPIGRATSGEAVFTYFPYTSPFRVLRALPVPEGTPRGYEDAARALLFTNVSGVESVVRFATFPDVHSVNEKLELANRYDLAGVAFFKWDGEKDQQIWDSVR